MEQLKNHQLIILFDRNQTNIPLIWDLANRSRENSAPLIKIGLSGNSNINLTVEGSINDVDKFHKRFIKQIKDRQLYFFRFLDTAGDDVRLRAYPILSTIEQELRSFINNCLIDAFGFIRNKIKFDLEVYLSVWAQRRSINLEERVKRPVRESCTSEPLPCTFTHQPVYLWLRTVTNAWRTWPKTRLSHHT